MGLELYQSEPASRAVFDRADDLLGFSISKLCFEGPEEQLTDTANQQPALLVTSIAMLRAMEIHQAPEASFFAGHSLGEFSALIAAESLSFEDGLELVKLRGRFMKEAGEEAPGAMAAILGLNADLVQALCEQIAEDTSRPLQIANNNCPGQIVISGDIEAVGFAVQRAKEKGAKKVVQLPVSIAAHSPLMASASGKFSSLLENAPIMNPKAPVIGNVSAAPLTSAAKIREELRLQLTSPVQWLDSMRHLLAHGVVTFYEVGAGNVLLSLMKRIDRKTQRRKWELPT